MMLAFSYEKLKHDHLYYDQHYQIYIYGLTENNVKKEFLKGNLIQDDFLQGTVLVTYCVCFDMKGSEEMEDTISRCAINSYHYAKLVLGDRFCKGEESMLKDAGIYKMYCYEVLGEIVE